MNEASAKRPDAANYPEWANSQLEIDYKASHVNQLYLINTRLIKNTFEATTFFSGFVDFLKGCSSQYKELHDAELLTYDPPYAFEVKPFNSVLNKSYRWNVNWNKEWPNKPASRQRQDWLTPTNWFEKLDDLVRATIVCKYIDGPDFLAARMKEYADSVGLKAYYQAVELESGYYAFHFYLVFSCSLVTNAELTENAEKTVKVEIQITTQMQELLRELLHKFYEQTRITSDQDDSWKWEHNTARFKSSFMGHTLHLLEGIVTELRDEMKEQ